MIQRAETQEAIDLNRSRLRSTRPVQIRTLPNKKTHPNRVLTTTWITNSSTTETGGPKQKPPNRQAILVPPPRVQAPEHSPIPKMPPADRSRSQGLLSELDYALVPE